MQNVFIPAHFTSYRILKRKHSRVFQQSFNNSKAKIFSHIIDIITTNTSNINCGYWNTTHPPGTRTWPSCFKSPGHVTCDMTCDLSQWSHDMTWSDQMNDEWCYKVTCYLVSGVRPRGYDLYFSLRPEQYDDVGVCQVHFPASRM